MKTFDRYSQFRREGDVGIPPSVRLSKKSTDYYETYKAGFSRLDLISNKYYSNPNYDWLILMANPELGSMEFEIPNNSEIRIPYPLEVTLQEYNELIKEHKKLY